MPAATLENPAALVDTSWLAAHLQDADLRIFDCSTQLQCATGGRRPFRVLDCAQAHAAGHSPGAGYFDLQGDFSRQDSPLGMTLADPETVTAAFEAAGIDDRSRVVLYSRNSPSWATRFWWMLHWLGFDRVAVLDGGFENGWPKANPRQPSAPLTPKARSPRRCAPSVLWAKPKFWPRLPRRTPSW